MKSTQVTGILKKNPTTFWKAGKEPLRTESWAAPDSESVSPKLTRVTIFHQWHVIIWECPDSHSGCLESSEEQTIIAFQISWQTFSKIICRFTCASSSDILTLAWQFVLWQLSEDHSEDYAQAWGSLGNAVHCAVTALPWAPQVVYGTGLVWSLWRGGQLHHHCWSK